MSLATFTKPRLHRAALVLLAAAPHAAAQCRQPDATSADLVQIIHRYTTATTGGDRTVRDSLRLHAVSADSLHLVTDDAMCRRAAAAYRAELDRNVDTFTGRVIVIKAADRYVILDPAYRYNLQGQVAFWFVMITDADFRRLSLM